MLIFCILFTLLVVSSELKSNALEIQEIPFSPIGANNSAKVSHISKKKQNQTRHFDWQKKDINFRYDETEEEFDVVTVYAMTSAPIIHIMPNAKQIVEKTTENVPEMAFSEFKAPEVGDVASILWGAALPESPTALPRKNDTQLKKLHNLNEHTIDSEVEVFGGHFLTTTLQPVSSSTFSEEKNLQLETDVEQIDVNSLKPSPKAPSSLETTTLTKLRSTTKFPLITKMTGTTNTVTTLSSTTEAEIYSAEETTPFSEARYLLGAPAKLLQSTTLLSAPMTSSTVAPRSAMGKIMAAMPSIDEDMIRTYTLKNEERYGHGHAKPRTITHELELMNFTKFDEGHSVPIDLLDLKPKDKIKSTTSAVKVHREV